VISLTPVNNTTTLIPAVTPLM